MKKIKVSIQDEHTLVLQEDATKGDLIDLRSLHEMDIDKSTIERVVKSIKVDEFNARLAKETQAIEQKKELEARLKEREIVERSKEAIASREQEIALLNSKIESIAKQIESETKVKSLEDQQKLEAEFRQQLADKELELQSIKHQKDLTEQKLQDQLRASETALVSLKEMRSRMSTKMIGESLELHCQKEFDKIRAIAFPNADFGKDNEVVGGSKGDFVFRERDENGNEILSIMFEMKNEDDNTAVKHKNKDFFKKLDKDRREKHCEFAVLVSLLEKDNDYYDDIVTVHDYENMYCIRPQHFITMIGFLRQGNLRSLKLQQKIRLLQHENIDVSNFEQSMRSFQDAFSRNYNLASSQFGVAIEEIDKTIDHLNKVKENLLKSDNNLRLANNKASELTIKKLTANSPSVAKAFEDLEKNHIS